MHPDEGRRPIISQSAPIASGPEHFQAKWNTWQLGKCDHTNPSQVEHLATRKMRPNKSKPGGTLSGSENATTREFLPASAQRRAPPGPISPYRVPSPRAYWRGPYLGISGSAGITHSIGYSKRTKLADGIRHIVNQQINAPGDESRAGCGDPGARCGRAVAECLSGPCSANRAIQLPNPLSKPTDDQSQNSGDLV